MQNILFYNCPDCNKPTFIKAGDDVSNNMQCEYCGHAFSVAADTRPFVMSTKIGVQEVYAFQEELPFPAL